MDTSKMPKMPKEELFRLHARGLAIAQRIIEGGTGDKHAALEAVRFAAERLNGMANGLAERARGGHVGRPTASWKVYVFLLWAENPTWDADVIYDHLVRNGPSVIAEVSQFEKEADGVERSTRIPTKKEVRSYLKRIVADNA